MRCWLGTLNVLHRSLQDTNQNENGEAWCNDDDNETQAAAESDDAPCPICGRTYYHVHKSAVRQGGRSGSDSD